MYQDIAYWVIDVDGTLTDSSIYYDETGNEMKKFSTRDAAGIFAARACEMQIIVITGRVCAATERRMKDLKVDYLFQNIHNKRIFLEQFMKLHCIRKEQLGYIGDDLNDLAAMDLAGFIGCPIDACQEIRERAQYISQKSGGYGAVRDVLEYVLRKSGRWEEAVSKLYDVTV